MQNNYIIPALNKTRKRAVKTYIIEHFTSYFDSIINTLALSFCLVFAIGIATHEITSTFMEVVGHDMFIYQHALQNFII